MIKILENAIMKKSILIIGTIFLSTITFAQQRLKPIYDENINPLEQIDVAVNKAKAENKFVICQVGGNWCPWCLRFADFVTNDSIISNIIDDSFVYIHVNYYPSRSNTAELKDRDKALLDRLSHPERFGFPVLVVLNEEGKVIHIQDSGYLEEDKSYNHEKTLRFFNNWTPGAVNNH